MNVVTRQPGPALAPYVTSLTYFTSDLPHARERVLPSGTMQLLINVAEDEIRTYDGADYATIHRTLGAVLQGPHARPTVIDTRQQRSIVCVGFAIGGSTPFFTPPAAALRDELVGLDELWGRDGAVLHERLRGCASPVEMLRLVEGALLHHVVRPFTPDPGMTFAVGALGRGVPVAAVVQRLGTTPKVFLRRFRNQVGLTPKRFARLRRFQRMLAAIPRDRPADWAEIAAITGYCDQSHLINDFQAFAGMTPTAYRPRSPGEHNHVAL
jgi:AraC-like DNA-binding protein